MDEIKQTRAGRIDWIDATRAVAIFAVYIGHYEKSAGTAYLFVFKFHVALFFLLAGMTKNLCRTRTVFEDIKKCANQLLIPYFFFAFASLLGYSMVGHHEKEEIFQYIGIILCGAIRNKYLAPSLWFLTCLFAIEILFIFLRRIKFKVILPIIGIATYYLYSPIIVSKCGGGIKWPYNIDSAFQYLPFFIAGYLVFPLFAWIMKADRCYKKVIIFVCGMLSFIYAIMLWNGNDFLVGYGLLGSIVLMLAAINIGVILQKVRFVTDIGKNTLYMCGHEWLAKAFFAGIVYRLFHVAIDRPAVVYAFTIGVLLVSNYLIVPIEKRIIKVFTIR